jgi:hypothetical protein
MALLIIKEDIRVKGSQKFSLVEPAQKERLVDPDIPSP